MSETIYRNLGIPVKHEGDEVTHSEFNAIVDTLCRAVSAWRGPATEYFAMTSHDRLMMYFLEDQTGALTHWYIGDTLLGRAGNAQNAGFTYVFPFIF